MMYVYARRQTRCGLGERALISPWLTQRECVQRTSVVGCKWLACGVCLGLFEYLFDVLLTNGAVVETGLHTVQSEVANISSLGRTATRTKTYGEVNTPKVSAGSRHATGPRLHSSVASVR